jgi:hypothetical protein
MALSESAESMKDACLLEMTFPTQVKQMAVATVTIFSN